jgi:hypothetical protein
VIDRAAVLQGAVGRAIRLHGEVEEPPSPHPLARLEDTAPVELATGAPGWRLFRQARRSRRRPHWFWTSFFVQGPGRSFEVVSWSPAGEGARISRNGPVALEFALPIIRELSGGAIP